MTSPYQVVKDFESALCDYTGAKYAVTTSSCTMALLLACAYHKQLAKYSFLPAITSPKRTYVSVPQSIIHSGFKPAFDNRDWQGAYQLNPLPVWDCARYFTSNMFEKNNFQCVSFHWSKILGIGQGGAILHDNPEADVWLRKARFDGRSEGVAPSEDTFDMVGWHCYMSPRDAAEGLSRLAVLPKHNKPLPNDDYPRLDLMEIFK